MNYSLKFSLQEPEVIDLARFLNDRGACVNGAGSDKLLIKGKIQLHGSECVVPPDQIEVGPLCWLQQLLAQASQCYLSFLLMSHV